MIGAALICAFVYECTTKPFRKWESLQNGNSVGFGLAVATRYSLLACGGEAVECDPRTLERVG